MDANANAPADANCHLAAATFLSAVPRDVPLLFGCVLHQLSKVLLQSLLSQMVPVEEERKKKEKKILSIKEGGEQTRERLFRDPCCQNRSTAQRCVCVW